MLECRMKLLSRRCIHYAVAGTLLVSVITCVLLVGADFLGLSYGLALPKCGWVVSAARPESLAVATKAQTMDSTLPCLVSSCGTGGAVSREQAFARPTNRKPSAVADALWHDYLMLYRFMGNGNDSTGSRLRRIGVQGSRQQHPGCLNHSSYLIGSIHLATYDVRLEELDALDFFVEPGGYRRPPGIGCAARANVAIIVPFRNRWEHLAKWLLHMHPFLQRQQLSYTIYVVNQEPGAKFNRGMLLNIGYKEASLAGRSYDCYIFHDVDLLPENDNNVYDCTGAPRHMSSSVDKFNYRLPYQWLIGGVVALTKEQFEAVNGYSNLFFGWGGEDDDFFERLLTKGYQVTRFKPSIARYRMLRHDVDVGNEVNPQRYRLLQRSHDRLEFDGLRSLRYTASDRKLCRMFTWISVEINEADAYMLNLVVT